jgi:hypothetical protein
MFIRIAFSRLPFLIPGGLAKLVRMTDWLKVKRSGQISCGVALVGAAFAWFRTRSYLRAHPSGAWFSAMDDTYLPPFWAVLGFSVTFIACFIVCSIAQMPPDPPEE